MAQKKVDIYAAKQPFSARVGDDRVSVAKGELARADHELVKNYPSLFEPVDNIIRFDVEQATQAPGEKRGEKRARKKPVEDSDSDSQE